MRRIQAPLALLLLAFELCACSRVTARPGETRARVGSTERSSSGTFAGTPGFGGGAGFGSSPKGPSSPTLPASGGGPGATVTGPAVDGKFAINLVGPNAPWFSDDTAGVQADLLIRSGVRWAFLPVLWAFSEEEPPTDEDDGGRWQGPSGKWHRYDLFKYRMIYDRLRAAGVEVAIGMYKHPMWAGGNPCYTFDKPECGIIYNDHKAIFSEAVADLASYLALQFPDAAGFSVWNEPDGDNFFSPEPPLRPDLVGEYLNLIAWPAKAAIQARREAMGLPPARIIGPELATAYDCGTGSAKDRNWGYRTEWLDNFAGSLLRYFPDTFDIYTIHNYSGNWWGPSCQVNRLKERMNQEGVFRPIWVTEANVADLSCNLDSRTVANFICESYKDNDDWWERTFFFTLNGPACDPSHGSTLLHEYEPADLYRYFQGIVNGSYRCYAH